MTQYLPAYDAVSFSDTAAQINLTATVVATYTVPGTVANKYRCQFSWAYDASVYVGLNATPVASTGGTITASRNVEFRPTVKFVKGGDVLSFYSTDDVADSGLSLLSLSA